MKKRVLILGAAGMAGHMILSYLKTKHATYDLFTIARNNNEITPDVQLDVTDFRKLENEISQFQPDFIINCIGILNHDAEQNIDKAILLNAYLPHFLERYSYNTHTKLIHISTDCVFSGKKGGYRENDFTDGKGFYAQSKALGEVNNHKDITIRTSIIGPELKQNGIGLLDWFMKQSGEVKGYTHAIWSGVTTLELAKFIDSYLQEPVFSGIIHLTNNQPISKYDLLHEIKKVYELHQISIIPFADYTSDKSFLNTRTDFQYRVPDYEVMLTALQAWQTNF
jgi:dTDP-4-dehydrorhamnose reductase